jgi:hypothetical protein
LLLLTATRCEPMSKMPIPLGSSSNTPSPSARLGMLLSVIMLFAKTMSWLRFTSTKS